MRLKELSLQDYRNIRQADFTPCPELTVICGKNGQGKTNLLEAVWLLTGGKSFRGAKDAELIARDQPFSVLQAETETSDGQQNQIYLTIGGRETSRPTYRYRQLIISFILSQSVAFWMSTGDTRSNSSLLSPFDKIILPTTSPALSGAFTSKI